MHSETVEKAGSPRKRVLSRGMSEEESLRHIIKEAEETNKRLSRSDSRYGSLKRGETRESQSEDDHAEHPEMMELQANYEDCLQELQALELRQEVLLFQVDCLQDALQGAEEMLAETQREAHEAAMELERERERRKKLEDTVALLTQEVERLKEEKNSVPPDPVKSTAQEEKEAVGAAEQDENSIKELPVSLDGVLQSSGSAGGPAGSSGLPLQEQKIMGLLASFFKNRRLDPSSLKQAGPSWLQGSSEGTSVDLEKKEVGSDGLVLEGEGSQKAPDGEDNDESSGYEDAPSEFSPASTPEGPLEAGLLEDEGVNEEGELRNSSDPRSPKDPSESCVLS
ncbi:leucine-rich repeat flightless-interacting protein 2 [Pygocentrus nattereri]|uniref:leucine-rich repeat flightless-interacting protein 2 n=1 Tax=Pygocentrus nattereri TaxID=42514 RepID=UPI000814773F|nr:leucine-rich repeat flightless-interacting protein 2 [Pygocentrus nattereri]